jgi:hypothetical protein
MRRRGGRTKRASRKGVFPPRPEPPHSRSSKTKPPKGQALHPVFPAAWEAPGSGDIDHFTPLEPAGSPYFTLVLRPASWRAVDGAATPDNALLLPETTMSIVDLNRLVADHQELAEVTAPHTRRASLRGLVACS